MRSAIYELINALSVPAAKPKYKLYVNESPLETPEELVRKPLLKPSRRFQVAAIDAAAATLHVPAGEVTVVAGAFCGPSSLRAYPGLRIGWFSAKPPALGAPIDADIEYVMNRYVKVGLKFVNDPDLPEGALSNDLRIFIETHMIKSSINEVSEGTVLLIDGPVIYPLTHPVEGSVWNAELGGLNEDRVNAMLNLLENGVTPVCIVKRVWRAKHLIKALGLSSDVTDVQMIMGMLRVNVSSDKPLMIGPWEVRGAGKLPGRIMAYLIIPLSRTPRIYTLFRVEVLKPVKEFLGDLFDDLISFIAYSTMSYGTYVPYRLYLADGLSKEVVSKNASYLENLLRINGVPLLYGGVTIE